MNTTDLTNLLNTYTALGEAGKVLAVVIPVVSLVLALMQCFFGYRLIRFWISLIGFLLGFAVGSIVSAFFMDQQSWIQLLIGVGVGLILALLAYRLYLAGVFLFCFCIAAMAMWALPWPQGGAWNIISWICVIVVGILAGYLAVRFMRPLLILLTSVCGAVNAFTALTTLQPDFLAGNENMHLIIVAGVAVLGLVIQFLTTRRYSPD